MTQIIQNDEITEDDIKPVTPRSTPGFAGRRAIVRWVAAGLLVIALASGIWYFLYSLSHESTDDAFIDGDIVAVSTRVSGHVISVHVEDNQWIRAGDLLVELDPHDFEARVDAARAGLESAMAADRAQNLAVEVTTITATAGLDEAKAKEAAVKAGVREAMARLALSRAALDQAMAEADSASARHRLDLTDLKRSREMAKTRTVSPRDLDHAKAAEQISAAALKAAEKKIDTQRAMVRQAVAVLQAAEADLRQAHARLTAARSAPRRIRQSRSLAEVAHAHIKGARAELAQARLNLSYTKIYAPCDGFVTKKGVEPGQFVQTGQSLLAIVPRGVWVTANFKETQLTHMHPGQPVDIIVDAYPDITFKGHVDSIQRGTGARFSLLPAENATGNYIKVVQRVPVKIVFDHPPEEIAHVMLAPGMSVIPDVNVDANAWPGRTLKKFHGDKASISAKNGAAASE